MPRKCTRHASTLNPVLEPPCTQARHTLMPSPWDVEGNSPEHGVKRPWRVCGVTERRPSTRQTLGPIPSAKRRSAQDRPVGRCGVCSLRVHGPAWHKVSHRSSRTFHTEGATCCLLACVTSVSGKDPQSRPRGSHSSRRACSPPRELKLHTCQRGPRAQATSTGENRSRHPANKTAFTGAEFLGPQVQNQEAPKQILGLRKWKRISPW